MIKIHKTFSFSPQNLLKQQQSKQNDHPQNLLKKTMIKNDQNPQNI